MLMRRALVLAEARAPSPMGETANAHTPLRRSSTEGCSAAGPRPVRPGSTQSRGLLSQGRMIAGEHAHTDVTHK